MTGLQNIRFAYFIGIGGIGMSALARYFKAIGVTVAGYDRTRTELTSSLEAEGIFIHYTDSPEFFPAGMNPGNTVVVYTPAVPADLSELVLLKEKGFEIIKRAKVLGLLCSAFKCVAVAGTHGKTTVSTMAATILRNSKVGCSAILGGISKNFNSNLLLPDDHTQWVVTEADEYDRSFLNLNPDIAVVTSVDADHLDIYGNIGELRKAFGDFVERLRPGGKAILKAVPGTEFLQEKCSGYLTYSMTGGADFYPVDIVLSGGPVFSRFSLQTPWELITDIEMTYPGYVNIENAVGAASAALLAGATSGEVRDALRLYKGVRRRFDLRYSGQGRLFFDDYAHHPEELKAFISSVRKMFPDRKLTGIFQPHLFSRTRDFAPEFAESLDLLDSAIVLPIYPARELPIPGITSESITSCMKNSRKFLLSKEEAKAFVATNEMDILLTMGAGDIDAMAGDFIKILESKAV